MQTIYKMKMRPSDRFAADTDAHVFVQLVGTQGREAQLYLTV